ncbi:MAG: hypothetical protein JXA67_10790, partial [Micromonosporaceae bacterium]|nr:hypothetical protein [Micromonosporaceae bacterium]
MIVRWRVADCQVRRGLGYAGPVLVAAAVTTTWFTPGRFFAAGDVPPYLRANLAGELAGLWNHQITGAGSSSYAVTQALDVGLLALAGLVGASPATAQQVLYALASGLAAFGAAYLAGAWVSHPIARAVAGLLGAFNVFLLVSYPNVLPAIAVGLIGMLVGMVVRAGLGRRITPLGLGLATLPASYLAQNPPLVAMTAVTVVAAVLASRFMARPGSTRRVLVLLLRAVPWAVALHCWWLVPCGYTLFTADSGSVITAMTDPTAWSWTQVRSGIANVLTLNTHWGWDHPAYVPYAAEMDAGGWRALRWAPLALAVTGVLIAERRLRATAWALAAAVVPLAVLAKGLHPPLESVNRWLYQHVPGMWLLREPMSKVGVLLVLTYVALAGIAVSRLCVHQASAWNRPASQGAVLLLVLAALAYPWPLWTGAVANDGQRTPPAARVAVPAGWQRLADHINADQEAGKLLILPLNPYYQISTSWGYYGVDTVPAQLVRRPVLQRLPGGYFSPFAEVDALLTGIETSLAAGDTRDVPGRLRALGVTQVLVRHDLVITPHVTPQADAETIEAALRRMPQLVPRASSPLGNLYAYVGTTGPVQLQSGLVSQVGDSPEATAAAVATLDVGEVLTTDRSRPASGVIWRLGTGVRTGTQRFVLQRAGEYSLTRSLDAAGGYRAAVASDGSSGLGLRLTDAERILVDGQPAEPRPPLWIPLTRSDPTVLVVDGRTQAVGDEVLVGSQTMIEVYAGGAPNDGRGALGTPNGGPRVDPQRIGAAVLAAVAGPATTLNLDAGEHSITVDRSPLDSATTASPLLPCPVPAGGSLVRQPDGAVELSAGEGSACARTESSPRAATGDYLLELEYRTIEGASARVCVWQDGPDRCADLPELRRSHTWQRLAASVQAEPDAQAVAVYLFADGRVAERTRVAYRNVRLTPVAVTTLKISQVAPLGATTASGTALSLLRSSSAAYTARIQGACGPFVVTLSESFAPGWRLRGLPSGWRATHFRA